MLPVDVVKAFVLRVNAGDVEGLSSLLTEDARLIDCLGQSIRGREEAQSHWKNFFSVVHDYQITAKQWVSSWPLVILFGEEAGSYAIAGSPLALKRRIVTPAAFRVVVPGQLIAEWQVYAAEGEATRRQQQYAQRAAA